MSGETVTIARAGRPVAKLVALSDSDEQPIFGALKGWEVDWEAFDQADADIENQFEEALDKDLSL